MQCFLNKELHLNKVVPYFPCQLCTTTSALLDLGPEEKGQRRVTFSLLTKDSVLLEHCVEHVGRAPLANYVRFGLLGILFTIWHDASLAN